MAKRVVIVSDGSGGPPTFKATALSRTDVAPPVEIGRPEKFGGVPNLPDLLSLEENIVFDWLAVLGKERLSRPGDRHAVKSVNLSVRPEGIRLEPYHWLLIDCADGKQLANSGQMESRYAWPVLAKQERDDAAAATEEESQPELKAMLTPKEGAILVTELHDVLADVQRERARRVLICQARSCFSQDSVVDTRRRYADHLTTDDEGILTMAEVIRMQAEDFVVHTDRRGLLKSDDLVLVECFSHYVSPDGERIVDALDTIQWDAATHSKAAWKVVSSCAHETSTANLSNINHPCAGLAYLTTLLTKELRGTCNGLSNYGAFGTYVHNKIMWRAAKLFNTLIKAVRKKLKSHSFHRGDQLDQYVIPEWHTGGMLRREAVFHCGVSVDNLLTAALRASTHTPDCDCQLGDDDCKEFCPLLWEARARLDATRAAHALRVPERRTPSRFVIDYDDASPDLRAKVMRDEAFDDEFYTRMCDASGNNGDELDAVLDESMEVKTFPHLAISIVSTRQSSSRRLRSGRVWTLPRTLAMSVQVYDSKRGKECNLELVDGGGLIRYDNSVGRLAKRAMKRAVSVSFKPPGVQITTDLSESETAAKVTSINILSDVLKGRYGEIGARFILNHMFRGELKVCCPSGSPSCYVPQCARWDDSPYKIWDYLSATVMRTATFSVVDGDVYWIPDEGVNAFKLTETHESYMRLEEVYSTIEVHSVGRLRHYRKAG